MKANKLFAAVLLLGAVSCSSENKNSVLNEESVVESATDRFRLGTFSFDKNGKELHKASLAGDRISEADMNEVLAKSNDQKCMASHLNAVAEAISSLKKDLNQEISIVESRYFFKEIVLDLNIFASKFDSFGYEYNYGFILSADGKMLITGLFSSRYAKESQLLKGSMTKKQVDNLCETSLEGYKFYLKNLFKYDLPKLLLEEGLENKKALDETLNREFYVISPNLINGPTSIYLKCDSASTLVFMPFNDNVATFSVKRIEGSKLFGTLKIPELRSGSLKDIGWLFYSRNEVSQDMKACEGSHENVELNINYLGSEAYEVIR